MEQSVYFQCFFFKEDEKTDETGNTVNERSAEHLNSAKGAYKLNTEFDNVFMIGSYAATNLVLFLKRYNTLAVGYGTAISKKLSNNIWTLRLVRVVLFLF
jgi:hypothetical protein